MRIANFNSKDRLSEFHRKNRVRQAKYNIHSTTSIRISKAIFSIAFIFKIQSINP